MGDWEKSSVGVLALVMGGYMERGPVPTHAAGLSGISPWLDAVAQALREEPSI